MKQIVAAFGISAFLFGAVGCAQDDNTPDVSELPPAVVAQLDPSLEVLVINPKQWHDEGRRDFGDADGERIGTNDDSFNRSWGSGDVDGTRAQLPGDDRQVVTSGNENKQKLDPADIHGSTSVSVGSEPPRNRHQDIDDPFAKPDDTRFVPPKNKLPKHDRFQDVRDRFVQRDADTRPSYHGGADQRAETASTESSTTPELDPCSCDGPTCVQDWVEENIGCGVCVVLTCGDNYYPHSCHTCQ